MPRLNNSLILILAVGSGLLAFLINLNLVKTKPSGSQANLLVVGAAADIEMGSVIRSDQIDLLPAPGNVNPKVLFTEFKFVEGKISRRSIGKGEVIKSVHLLGEGESAASLIPAGYRAMVIPATIPDSLANLIQVGSHVDVLLTYEKSRGEYDSVTLVTNVKVIGVTEPAAKGSGGGGNKELSITLAVSPEGAETLAYSMKKGTLNVIVRSRSEAAADDQEQFFTLKELFFSSDKVGAPETQPEERGVEIIRGLKREKYQFTNTILQEDLTE